MNKPNYQIAILFVVPLLVAVAARADESPAQFASKIRPFLSSHLRAKCKQATKPADSAGLLADISQWQLILWRQQKSQVGEDALADRFVPLTVHHQRISLNDGTVRSVAAGRYSADRQKSRS